MRHVATTQVRLRAWNASELTVYFVLAYGISWALWLPVLLRRRASPFSLSAATFGPTLAAMVTHRVFTGNWRAVRLWTTLPDVLRGIASGASAVLVAAFTAAFFMTESGIARWQWSSLIQILTLFGPNLLGGPLGEEAGWRGYALPRLQRRFHPVGASLLLGFLWGNWHLPLIVAHVYNVTWWEFTALTVAASVFLSFGFNISKGSTVCAIIVHGVYNVGTGIILNDLIGKATLHSNTIQHRVLWLAYTGVAALVCVITKGQLSYRAICPSALSTQS